MAAESNDETEAEMQWRLNVLKLMAEEGKIHISEHLWQETKESLEKIRYRPNGTIDLDTVDGRIRSMALMAAHVHEREQAKQAISLFDISSYYFETIEKNLGFLKKEADDRGLNAYEFASLAIRSQEFVDDVSDNAPRIIEFLESFWKDVADSAYYHLQDLRGTKGVFGGDLFPSHKHNISSSLSLYIDTIVLSDPFLHSRPIFQHAEPANKAFLLVKHALNVLQYKNLAEADVGVPIVTLVPFKSTIDADENEFLQSVAAADALKHASRLFGRTFTEETELWEFVEPLNTPDQVVSSLVEPSRLLFDTEWTEDLESQIRRSIETDWSGTFGSALDAGAMVAIQCFGRMGQATDLLFKSRYLGGVPIVDAPTSWEYFNWKLEYNSAVEPESDVHLHMVKGLQHASTSDEKWLGNIPPEAIIEMRRSGAFQEIRSVLSQGVDELSQANPNNFFRASDQIVENIRDAFEKHTKEVQSLRRKTVKFAGHDIGTMLVAGAIDIASIVTGTPTFGAASFCVNQFIDVPKLRQIPARFRELKGAHKELKKSPIGLLFRHRSG
ncbi:MCP four helix bundle domain-containing protein [Rhodobium gokarnense]|uniref:Uncharacterized protein n=1 Tax=Rhodobium gokarnense TaxID=364296 RepID=A0ABT3HGN6_9HYPH|nr:hypothetical protein [Rhodobium gokarnense]MCW2309509.1 hypothetical protein [Rhodobium gokarnense]